ncbi:MAG: prepilin-type N-terminal cleavage/methylation domain-containing protein [Gammaproteobacteria bacterium]|nr:prepilin-type N-terminal cleavage/methylation domain-containing protein [Gammaproteobacteria bacterium]
MHTQDRHTHAGFTLIEMAVVLVIVGLLLGGMLVPLATQMETDRRKETTATLESIREALIGFAVVNRRLPCPDTNADGREDCPSGAPNGGPKGLPFADLGVSSTDAWDNTWRYAVTNAFTTAPPGNFTLASVGNINVGTLANNCTAVLLASNVPALVWSGGKTANGGAFEAENTIPDTDSCYLDAGYRQTGNRFDDLIVWIPPGVLFNRMVAAEKLP